MVSALLIAAALASANPSEAPARWELNASILTGSPATPLPGLSVGAAAEVRRALAGPLFGSLRLGWAEESEANPSWIVDHHLLEAALGLGIVRQLGVGRVWAQAGGGAGGVYEVLSRHQIDRIQNAGVPGGEETAFTLGPHAFGELGVALQVHAHVSGLLAFGPWLFRSTVDGAAQTRAGFFARLGVVFEL